MTALRLAPGSLLGDRFVLEQLAGSGGMGEVYRARDVRTQETVAVKVLHRSDPAHATRFLREARVLAQLQHPSIVRYVAHGDSPSLYLVMEWLEGEDLGHRLSRHPLDVKETVLVARRVAEALGAAHAHGVVHRDIKPGNIFLLQRRIERVRLLDFGIAFLAQGTRAVTVSGQVLGTLGYMAPEQASEGRKVTAAADVFSLGCLIFECLTGRAAFPGERLMEVLAKILFAETPRVSDLCLGVHPALDEIVARMMQKAPDARPSLAVVAAELEALEAAGAFDGARYPLISAPATVGEQCPVTADERRLVAVVVVEQQHSTRGGATSPTLSVDTLRRVARELGDTVAPHGGRVEVLATGATRVVFVAASEAATDLAARAARCGLAVRRVQPNLRVAVGMGRADPTSEESVGAVAGLVEKLLGDDDGTCAGIRVDALTMGLLDERFVAGGDAEHLALVAEQPGPPTPRRLLGRERICVGRERELNMMAAVAQETLGEPIACALLVTGVEGSGKSRLAHEFLGALSAQYPAVELWRASADVPCAGSSFALLRRLLGDAAGAEQPAQAEDALRARVARHVAADDVDAVVGPLAEVLRPPAVVSTSEDIHATRHDVASQTEHVSRALELLLAAETAHHPLVILLEDLQWGDRPTVRLLDAALRTLRERPLLVLALARPDVHETFPELWSGRRVQEIRLGGLTPSASRKLVVDVLGDRVDRTTVDALVEKAAGNPWVLEELVRAVAEGTRAVPDTVLAMVQSRLERLEPLARRALRAASIFGATFWAGGVSSLLGTTSAAEVDAVLAELEKNELVVRVASSRFATEDELAFRQTLVRSAAHQMLTERDEKAGHRAAAEWLEAHGERDAMVLAEHLERGGEPLGAVVWFLWAAEQAFAREDLSAVIVRAERGIACGASGPVLGELRLLQAEAMGCAGLPDHARVAREAMLLLSATTGSAAWCRAAAELAVASARAGDVATLDEVGAAIGDTAPDDLVTAGAAIAVTRAALELSRSGLPRRANALIAWILAAQGLAAEEDAPVFAALGGWLDASRALDQGDSRPIAREGEAIATVLAAAGHPRQAAAVRAQLEQARAVASRSSQRPG